jgi:hypothetical protein
MHCAHKTGSVADRRKKLKGKGIMSNPNTVQIQSSVKVSGWGATMERRGIL